MSSYSQLIQAESGLIGYWPLDSEFGITDLSSQGNDGTAVGGVTIGTADGPGDTGELTATDFDGVNDNITTAYGIRQNVCTNPKAGAVTTTGWTMSGLSTFEALSSVPTSDGLPSGVTTSFHCISSANAQRATFSSIAVTLNQTYTFSMYVRLTSLSASLIRLHVRDDAGVNKGQSSDYTLVGNGFARLSVTITADANGTNWKLDVQQIGAGAAEWHHTSVLIETGSSLGTYFDGSSIDGLWSGTANASVSNKGSFLNGSIRTYEGWAYRDSTSANHNLLSSDAATTAPVLQLSSGNNNVTFDPDNGTAGGVVSWVAAWPGINQWVHWMLVCDESGNTAALYINGIFVSSQAMTQAYSATAGNFEIACRGTNNAPFNGRLAHIAMYSGDKSSVAPSHYNAIIIAVQKARTSVSISSIPDTTYSWVKSNTVRDLIKPTLLVRTGTDNNYLFNQKLALSAYGGQSVEAKALMNASRPGMRLPGILNWTVTESLESITQQATVTLLNALPVSRIESSLTTSIPKRWLNPSISEQWVTNGLGIPTRLVGDKKVSSFSDPKLNGIHNSYKERNLVFRIFQDEQFTLQSSAQFPNPSCPSEETEGSYYTNSATGAGSYFVKIDDEVMRVVSQSGNTFNVPPGGRAQNGILQSHTIGATVTLLAFPPYTGDWTALGYLNSNDFTPYQGLLRPGTCLVSYEGYGDMSGAPSKAPTRWDNYAFTGYWFVRSSEVQMNDDGVPNAQLNLLSAGYVLTHQKINPNTIFSAKNRIKSWAKSAFDEANHKRNIPGDWVDYNAWDPSLKDSYPLQVKVEFAQHKAFFDHMSETQMGKNCEICQLEWLQFKKSHGKHPNPILEARAVGRHIYKESIRVFSNGSHYSAGPIHTYILLMTALAIGAWDNPIIETSLAQRFTKLPNRLFENLMNAKTGRVWNGQLSFKFKDEKKFHWDNQTDEDNVTHGFKVPLTCSFEAEYDRQEWSQPMLDFADMNGMTFQLSRRGFPILKPQGFILRAYSGDDSGEWHMSQGGSVATYSNSLDVENIVTMCYVTGTTALDSEFTIAASGTSWDVDTHELLWHSMKVGNKEGLSLTANVQQTDNATMDNQTLGLDWNTRPEFWGEKVLRQGDQKAVYKKPTIPRGSPPLRNGQKSGNHTKRIKDVQNFINFFLIRAYIPPFKNAAGTKWVSKLNVDGKFSKDTETGLKEVQQFMKDSQNADNWGTNLPHLDADGVWNHTTERWANAFVEHNAEYLMTDVWWYVQRGIPWDVYVMTMIGLPVPQIRSDQGNDSNHPWAIDQLALKKEVEVWQKKFLHKAINVGNRIVDVSINKAFVRTITSNMADPRVHLGDVIWVEMAGHASNTLASQSKRPPLPNGVYVTDITRTMDLQQGTYTANYSGYRFRGQFDDKIAKNRNNYYS